MVQVVDGLESTKMNFVKIVLCTVLLWHLLYVEGVKFDLFSVPADQTELDVACCLDRFDKYREEGRIKQRSIVALLPDASDISRVEAEENSLLWSFEVWQSKNYRETYGSVSTEKNYILLETDEKGFSMNLSRSSNVCVVKIIQCNIWNNSIRAEHPSERCMISNRADIRKERMTSLQAAGAASFPFAYYDTAKGKLKGIDISLTTTLAEKLELPLSVNMLNINTSEALNAPHSPLEFSYDR